MSFVYVPLGTFSMGSPEGERGRFSAEVQRQITITRPLLVQTTEATQHQWQTLMGTNPSSTKGKRLPVDRISWVEATAFCNALSRSENLPECYDLSQCSGTPGRGDYKCANPPKHFSLDCEGYRLPTDAEWEYFARAGATGAYYLGEQQIPGELEFHPDDMLRYDWKEDADLDKIAWYSANSGGVIQPVGEKLPNAWGIYDVLGNVHEFTWLSYRKHALYCNADADPLQDPVCFVPGKPSFSQQLRGCHIGLPPAFCRLGLTSISFNSEYVNGPGTGFRVVRTWRDSEPKKRHELIR